MNVRGKVFVVTGAGNGIAREVTLQLLAKGARVAGVDLNGKGLEETAALATATATASADRFTQHVVNITDREAVAAATQAQAMKTHPRTRRPRLPRQPGRSSRHSRT